MSKYGKATPSGPSTSAIRRPAVGRTRTVYVVGAGFSADLGYPLTSNLLCRLWKRIKGDQAARLAKVIRFHHPRFEESSLSSFPDIEELLTEMSANEDLLTSLRARGPFTVQSLRDVRNSLLQSIAEWFHDIYRTPRRDDFLCKFARKITREEASLILFNWDLELDTRLAEELSADVYGITSSRLHKPCILKPHGSLNWYLHSQARHLKKEKRVRLWSGDRNHQSVWAFNRPRAPISSRREYVPWIVPPTHLKSFGHPMLQDIWRRCVEVLSTANKIYFLGYSLPRADWHSRYIFRCGFHNQREGLPRDGRNRMPATGGASIYIVNPDQGAARRIEEIVGWTCHWIPERIQDWAKSGFRDS